MPAFALRVLALAASAACALPALAADDAGGPVQTIEVSGTRQRLDAARNGLSPDTGSSIFHIDRQDIQNLPLGSGTPLNQVILQTPGVVQDSYGQLHVRGDHGNVQYRINGVIIPESISGFGQTLQTRFADHLSILTGALPAQYGLRNAAVVDIQTKADGSTGNTLSLALGSHGHVEPGVELAATHGSFSYYLTGSFERNDLGVENPTPAASALHDRTRQSRSFGSLGYVLGDDSRVSLMFGTVANRFQIPDLPGQSPSYTTDFAPPRDSATLDANQRETTRFAVVSYQGRVGARTDYQLSLFTRSTDVRYQPDPVGDLQYHGVAASVLRRNLADGLQGDFSFALSKEHTLRYGLFAQRERFTTQDDALVFPADADGRQTSGTPREIDDGSRITGRLWSAYLQDEWKPAVRKGLTFNYGVRYDQARTVVDERQLSPRLGLVVEASRELTLHAGFARYFTPPPTEKIDTTSVQKFAGTTNALPSDANTSVKSERSDYYDLGVSWQATPHLVLGADAYDRRVRHLQDEGQFGNALIYSAFNYARGRLYGIDLSATFKDKALAAYANLSFGRALGRGIESGQFNFDADELAYLNDHWVHLDHEQSASGSAGASYRFGEGWTASADVLFGSGLRRGFANTEHLPGYASVDVALGKSFEGRLDLRVSVVNLFDRVYELRDGSGIGVGAPQWGQRRGVMVSLEKGF